MLYINMYYEGELSSKDDINKLISDIKAVLNKFEMSVRLEVDTTTDFNIFHFNYDDTTESVLKAVFNKYYPISN